MRERRTYTPQQKAAAVARLLAGETPAVVSADTGIPAGTVGAWSSQVKALVLTSADHALAPVTLLNEELAALVLTEMRTLKRHMEHYGSDEWIRSQPAATLLESTRAVGRALVAVVDRLAGARPGAGQGEPDDED